MKNPFGNFGLLAEAGNKQIRSKLGLPAAVTAIQGAHPTLTEPVGMLAQQSANFNVAVENLLMKHGKGIMEEQMMVNRVADVAIDLYAMAAVVSRASRSIERKYETVRSCRRRPWAGRVIHTPVPAPQAPHEASLATAFCSEANMRVKENLRQIREPDGVALDNQYEKVAKELFEQGHYFAQHPIGV